MLCQIVLIQQIGLKIIFILFLPDYLFLFSLPLLENLSSGNKITKGYTQKEYVKKFQKNSAILSF